MPRVVSSMPSGIVAKDNIILAVKTNEIATCKYDTTNNTYGNLSNIFANTGSSNHNQTINNLNQGEYIYYVRCQDAGGYAMNDSFIIRFTIDLPPSAQITLSDSSPVKAGTIEVNVLTSENLENPPTLEYTYNDAPAARKQISLTGSNSLWKGYLIVTELDNNKIGTFYFSATDIVGNTGTKITSGNIFVVDTTKPAAPQSVKTAAEPDGSILINWYYDGEEADYFSVYRSTSSGLNYVDFYAESNGSSQFIDRATIDKVTYYYKISTVDKAGNVGPLSEEVFATSVNKAAVYSPGTTSEDKTIDIPKVLPPTLVPKVDTYIKKIDKLIIDVKDVFNQFEEKQGEEKQLLGELKILEQINETESKLESLKSQLESFKDYYATEEDLDKKLNSLDLEIKKIEKSTPKEIKLLEKSESTQSTSNEDIINAVDELFSGSGSDPIGRDNYIKKNEKEKDKIKVDVLIKVISITFLDDTKSEKSLIKKRISYQNQGILSDVLVIESIPKSSAESVNEIIFDQKYDVLKEDPVVKFGFLKFNPEGEEITYSLGKIIKIDDFKDSKTVVLISPNQPAQTPNNKFTGSLIFSFGNLGLSKIQAIFVWIGIFIIIGLSTYYLLFVKDYKYLFKKLDRTLKMKKIERSLNAKSEYLPELPPLPSKNLIFADSLKVSDEDANRLLNELYLHINEVKAELADKLLPLFVTLNNKLESKGFKSKSKNIENNNIIFLNSLINQAHEHLDSNLHNEAVKLYPKINFIYQNLPKKNRTEVYEQCDELHKRINNLKPLG
ncbi:MAG: hypothetical protein AABX32_05540 [Nanoarchaeota archaeon]